MINNETFSRGNKGIDDGLTRELLSLHIQLEAADRPGIELPLNIEKQLSAYARSNVDREVGGILIGRCEKTNEKNRIVVTGYLKAKKTAEEQTFLTFTSETWRQIYVEQEILYPDEKIVGWFHSRPNAGLDLTYRDRFIETNFSDTPWAIAYLINPSTDEKRMFYISGNEIKRADGQAGKGEKEASSTEPVEPLKDPRALTQREPGQRRSGTKGQSLALGICILLLLLTNWHRFDPTPPLQEEPLQPEQEVPQEANDQQGQQPDQESLISELNRYQEKLAEMQQQQTRMESLIEELSGERLFVYTVSAGDTLWSISSRFYNDPMEYQYIMRLNGLEQPEDLEVGQSLLLFRPVD